MATLYANKQLTLLELAKRTDPSGNLAVIAEVLARDNEILTDALWLEANDTFAHKIVQRMSLPTGSWRQLNAGVSTESSQTRELYETIGMLETYSEADKDLVLAAANPSQFRSSEASAFLEGLSQTLASTIIYGNAGTDPEKFTGLAPRLDALAQKMVFGAGGSGGDTTSVFAVQWGENKVFMTYPKGSPSMGIKHSDLGEVTKVTSTGTMYQVYRDHFQVKCGLVVKDERCIARIANCEISGSSNIFDEDLLIQALNYMPQRGSGAVIYANADMLTYMDIIAKDKANVLYSIQEIFGVPTVTFRGCPVRKVDAILSTETVVA
jgi:hypothetical protein